MTKTERLNQIKEKHFENNSNLYNENIVLIALEGFSHNDLGTARIPNKHPDGRIKATLIYCFKHENFALHYTSYCSTLPDDPMGDGADNDGTPVPTIMTGTYDLHSCYHLGKYRAFELKEPGKESVPVIRKTGISTSNYINVHGRDMIDKNPTSTGCITILRNEFHKILLTVGLESSDFANRKRQGAMVIDRSYISKKCQNYYKALYGEYYKYCFNTPEPVFTDIESHWCERIVISLKEKGIINGYPDGTMRPDQQPTRAEVFAIANNIIKYMEDK